MSPVAEFLGQEVARRTSVLSGSANQLVRIASELAQAVENGEHADLIASLSVTLASLSRQFEGFALKIQMVQEINSIVLASEPVEA
jgi:hypothetical protein